MYEYKYIYIYLVPNITITLVGQRFAWHFWLLLSHTFRRFSKQHMDAMLEIRIKYSLHHYV